MKSYFLILLIIIIGQSSMAQTFRFEGIVVDTTGQPLELANVVAEELATQVIASFGVTNSDGSFFLDLKPDSSYVLKSSFIGFLPFEKTIVPAQENQPFKIVLTPSAQQLRTVEIIEDYPVVITDDTITYKADAFTQGNERKLEDVLKDIPGFEVDENGEIKVQGKSVEKVLVEGKEFFDGDSKLATKNIPANAIDKVQVLRNFNDVSPLGDVSSEERLALNIKLKEGKKEMVFGDAEVGAGLQDRYFGHANLFYYNPKLNINLITDGNNIGRPAFTTQDYFRFSGGLRSLSSRSGSMVKVNSSDLGFMSANPRSAEKIESSFGASNFNYAPNKKWSVTGFGILSGNNTGFRNESYRTFLTGNTDLEEYQNTSNQQKLTGGMLKMGLKFTPNASWHINAQTLVKSSEMEADFLQTSTIGNSLNNEIENKEYQDPFSIKQQLNLYYARGDKDVFSLENSLSYSRQDPTFLLNALSPLFVGSISNGTNSYNSLNQQQQKTSEQQESLFNYYRILNPTNHINLIAGRNYTNQELFTDIQDGSTGIDLGFGQSAQFMLTDWFTGIGFKSKQGAFVFYPSATLHYYESINKQAENAETLFSTTQFLPAVNVKFEINSAQSLTLDYGLKVDFFEIEDLLDGLVIENYSMLKTGNPTLKNARFHDLNLSYYNFDLFSFFNLYGGINYQKKLNDFSNAIDFTGINRVTRPINLSNANEFVNGYLTGSKTFLKWKVNASGQLSYSNIYNEVEGESSLNESFVQSFKGSFETTLFQRLFLELGYQHIRNSYEGNQNATIYTTYNPFVSTEVSFLKHLTFEAKYEYFDYRNQSGSLQTSYAFLTGSLAYQKESSPWRLSLNGLNMLNTQEIRNDSFSNNLIATNIRSVQPFYMTFNLQYDF